MYQEHLSPSESLQWYFDRAAEGVVEAERELGRMYLHGFTHDEDPSVGINPDSSEALRWLTQASDAGDDQAAWLLGILHDERAAGGALDDPEKAFACYRQAVDRGCRPAQFYLAVSYLLGRGTERDDRRGRELLVETAYGGDTDAQRFMGEVCRKDGDEEGAVAWAVVASVFSEDEGESITGKKAPRGALERSRLMVQRINIYSVLVQCDDPTLMKAADLMRESFYEEI